MDLSDYILCPNPS